MAWAQKRAQVRSQVRPMVGRRGGSPPSGYLFMRYKDADGSYSNLLFKGVGNAYQSLAYKVA
jgi:hypothetical protein